MQFATAAHGPRVGRVGILDPQRDVALELLVEPVADLSRGDVLPFLARERRVVHEEVDADRRLFDGDPLEPLGMLDVGDREPDLDALEARQRHDLARRRALHLGALEPIVARTAS